MAMAGYVGRGADDGIDVAALFAGSGHGLLRGLDGDFGHQRQLVVGTGLQPGVHAVDIQDACLVHHIALLDARGLLNELDARGRQGRDGAGFDLCRMLGVELLHVGVEGRHQLGVGDDVGRLVKTSTADDDRRHDGQAQAETDDFATLCLAADQGPARMGRG